MTEEEMKERLAYGKWILEDYSIVFFNRRYVPFYKIPSPKSNEGYFINAEDSFEYDRPVLTTTYLYDDSCPPWRNKDTRDMLNGLPVKRKEK